VKKKGGKRVEVIDSEGVLETGVWGAFCEGAGRNKGQEDHKRGREGLRLLHQRGRGGKSEKEDSRKASAEKKSNAVVPLTPRLPERRKKIDGEHEVKDMAKKFYRVHMGR